MKIAVNLFLASPTSITGAFVYIEDILPALLAAGGGHHELHLLGHAETIRYFRQRYPAHPALRYRIFDVRRDLYANPLRAAHKAWAKLRGDNALRERIVAGEVQAYIRKKGIDVYFSPSGAIYPRGLSGVAHVTTILDLQPEYFPDNFPAAYLRERQEINRYAIGHSGRLIAISHHTKQTLIETYGADPEKIAVIYFAPHDIPESPVTITLPQEFLFYPAALWPHKNHRLLIEALALLKDRFPTLHAVCAGVVKRKALKQELEDLARSRGLSGRVHFPGFVSGGDLRSVYQKTRAMVFPSSFEGFGIPLVEAMEHGVPVIAADNTSITEVVADAGLLVETGNAEALAKAIERVLTDERLRSELVRKGRERAKMFSWERSAQETLAAFAG